MCVGGGKLYSAGSDQSIISWNLENLTLHKRVEVYGNLIILLLLFGTLTLLNCKIPHK